MRMTGATNHRAKRVVWRREESRGRLGMDMEVRGIDPCGGAGGGIVQARCLFERGKVLEREERTTSKQC